MASIHKTFHKGDVIVHEGHHAGNFYVIEKGQVEVLKQKSEQEIRLAVLGPGEFFGEVGLLDPDKDTHSATVRSLEETSVTIMSREDFNGYVEKLPPGMRNLLRKLAHRLRETSLKVEKSEQLPQDEEKKAEPEPRNFTVAENPPAAAEPLAQEAASVEPPAADTPGSVNPVADPA